MVSNSAAGAHNTVTGRPIRVAKLFKSNNHRAVGTRTDLLLATSHQWRYRSGRSQITDMVTSPLPLAVTPCLHLKAQRRPGTPEKGAAKFRSRFKWTSTTQGKCFYTYLSYSHPGEPDETVKFINCANAKILRYNFDKNGHAPAPPGTRWSRCRLEPF